MDRPSQPKESDRDLAGHALPDPEDRLFQAGTVDPFGPADFSDFDFRLPDTGEVPEELLGIYG